MKKTLRTLAVISALMFTFVCVLAPISAKTDSAAPQAAAQQQNTPMSPTPYAIPAERIVDGIDTATGMRVAPLSAPRYDCKGSVGAAEYNAHDYEAIRSFLELTDSTGVKNGDKLWESYDPDDPMTWETIIWTEDGRLQGVGLYADVLFQTNVDESIGVVGELDLSNCEYLEFVDIVCSVVTGVDVSNCPSLFFVSVFYSELEYIYVDNCPEIRDIWLAYNRNLTSLDLSGVPLLWQLILPGNGLTSLDLSFCPELQILECDNNSLTSLDVSMLSNLQSLRCENQYWEMPNNNSFTSLDLSNNENLVEFTCYNTGVSELNVAGLTTLTAINCNDCNLSTLDVTGCESIEILAFANNNISDIDTSGIAVPMMTFESSYNPIDQTVFEKAVYPHGKELQFLHCAGNNLTSFDKSMFEWLGELELSSNDFSVLDISNARLIDIQNMGEMERVSIELTEYNYIFVDGSSPAEFLLVGDPSTLSYLSCNGCGLSSIPDAVFESEALRGLLCADNNLTGTLDLSMSASLSELDCSGNAIDSLILSEESEFSQLIVKDTGISELHVENSYNGAPISLHAENGYVGLSLQGSREYFEVDGDIVSIKHADTVLWAAPAQGYEFAGWYDAQGGLVSSELEYKLEEGYEYDLTAAFVEAVEPTEEPTDEPVVTSEPTDEPVVTSEPTDEPVVTSEPSPEVPPTGFAGMALLGIAAVSAGIGITAYRRRED